MTRKAELYSAFYTLSKSTNGGQAEFSQYEALRKQILDTYHGGIDCELDATLRAWDKARFVAHWSKEKPPIYMPRERAWKTEAEIRDFNQRHGKA